MYVPTQTFSIAALKIYFYDTKKYIPLDIWHTSPVA